MTKPSEDKASGRTKRDWFKPEELYKKGQPYTTYAGYVDPAYVEGMVRFHVRGAKGKVALEVGPGEAPVIRKLPFDRHYYVDVSLAVLRKLKTGGGSGFALGRAERLPLNPKARFHVVVMNEVLTHVPPEKREAVVRQVAGHAGEHFFITDRSADALGNPVDQRHAEGIGFVNALKLKEVLEKSGFHVSVEHQRLHGWPPYFLLHAQRKEEKREKERE